MLTPRLLLPVVFLALLAGGVSARAETVTVIIDKLVFSPADIQVRVGDTIEWVNKDPFAHTATVKGGWEVMIPPRKTAGMTMQKAGTFDYFCRFHPNMKGHVTVVE